MGNENQRGTVAGNERQRGTATATENKKGTEKGNQYKNQNRTQKCNTRRGIFIRPKEDFCLKELLRNEVVRRYFISDVLEIPLEEIRETRLTNTFLWKKHREQKLGILDVLIEMNDDTLINVELQLKAQKYWDKRQIYYVAKIYVSGLQVGQEYDRVRKCAAISLLDFNLTEDEDYHSVYRLRDQTGRELSDSLEIHIIELKKRLDGNRAVDEWIRFLNIETREELEQMQTKNRGIAEAIRELKEMNLGKMLWAEYEYRLKTRRDQHAREEYVRDEGISIGREEGISIGEARGIDKGKAELQEQIIMNLIHQGEADERILTIVGCDREQVEKLRKG